MAIKCLLLQDGEDYVLQLTNNNTCPTEIRSQKNYIYNYDSEDELHKFLDKFNDTNIDKIMNGNQVFLDNKFNFFDQKKTINFLTFNVVFAMIDHDSFLRVFHDDKIIDEITASSHYKTVQIDIKYQKNLMFQFFSKTQENSVCFFLVQGSVTPIHKENFYSSQYLLVYDDHEVRYWDYNVTFPWWVFGGEIYGKKLFHNQVLKFSANLAEIGLAKKENYLKWQNNDVQFKSINCNHIAKYRNGIMCTLMKRKPKEKINKKHMILQDIFESIEIEHKSNSVILRKNNRTKRFDLSRLMKIQNIANYQNYFDAILDLARLHCSYVYYF